MFSFNEELKWYEPGLETVEESLSGDEQKDLVELIQVMLKARAGGLAEEVGAGKSGEEGTQLAIEDALEGPGKEAKAEAEEAEETEETETEDAAETMDMEELEPSEELSL
ncbi:MAG: hypothetical protein IJ917_06525 [Firmicutes bacterium]|nr:hypothetical protein [Bacillota bacterium]